MSEIEVIKVERPDGTAVSVRQMIGNICIEWKRGKDKQPIEVNRWKPGARVYNSVQLEISEALYGAAVNQARAVLFPRKTSKSKRQKKQLALF